MEICTFRAVHPKLILALLVTSIAGVTSCAREETENAFQTRDRPLPDQVISDFSITETSMGKKDWSMKADKAYVYEKRNLLEAQVVEITFFDDNGRVQSVLKADHGKLNRNSGDMEARGDVVVVGSDGVVLQTQSLSWEGATREIVSEDSVKIIRNQDVLTGWGFRGDPDLGSFTILRKMRARIKATEEITEGGQDDDPAAEN